MAKVSSFANIGDTVIFKKSRGKWQDGWKVVGVTPNEHGVIIQIIVDKGGRAKQQLHMFDDKSLVFVEPPKDEVTSFDDILADYPNLRIIRRRASEPPAYMLFCMKCHDVVSVKQVYSEVSEIVLWSGRVQTSKPSIDDGQEAVICSCPEQLYEITLNRIEADMTRRRLVITVAVPCCGEMHRVGLKRDGTFVYFNHSHESVRRFLLLAEIGGPIPECLNFRRVEDSIAFPEIPTVKRNRRFQKAVQRVQWRRTTLRIIREKKESGARKKMRKGTAQLMLIQFRKSPEQPKPPPKVDHFPKWVPTYLKQRCSIFGLRPPLITHRRFKQLRSRGYRRPKAKVTWRPAKKVARP